MEQIVNTLSALKGVHYASLYKDGTPLASTFPPGIAEGVTQAQIVIEQIFSALMAIQKSHNELYFSLENKFISAYLLHDGYIAILLTEKKINFPLINMSIKSASEKIRHRSEECEKEEVRSRQETTHTSNALVPVEVATDSAIIPDLQKISEILTSFLGPVANLIVEDNVVEWKKKYIQNRDNLPHLIDAIKQELFSDAEKEDFVARAFNALWKE